MEQKQKIQEIQKRLKEHGIDGWLLYDNHGSNRFIRELLEIPAHLVLTRRFFYWIPKSGEPELIVHQIEAQSLGFLTGKVHSYLSWEQLDQAIVAMIKNNKTIAMEYSPNNRNPYVSIVDAGTFEQVAQTGAEIISSDDLLQHFTSVLDEDQIASHLDAAKVVAKTVERAWDLIADRLRKDKVITEYDVQKFILSEFSALNYITDSGPCCSVNQHSALPHYQAGKKSAQKIDRGDFILIDLWCKKNVAHGVYADITRVAVAAPEPTPRQEEVFDIVNVAQSKGIALIKDAMRAKKTIRGFEVDDVCRGYIEEKGYGAFFTHRTGHNIDTNVHGAGAHLDHLETVDHRKLLPGTICSVEPGIYLPQEFGVRLEHNVLIDHASNVQVTGKQENEIRCLL